MPRPTPKVEELPSTTPLTEGLVLYSSGPSPLAFDRITHIFSGNVYVMRVSGVSEVRKARRPKRVRLSKLAFSIKNKTTRIGRLSLPPELSAPVNSDSDEELKVEAAFSAIEPLLDLFKVEQNLDRYRFTTEIRKRALQLGWSETSLRRLLLRWWYFGGGRSSLRPIIHGPLPGTRQSAQRAQTEPGDAQGRPGRQSALVDVRGPNEFRVTAHDIKDMIDALKRLADGVRKQNPDVGHVTISDGYREWLHTDFAKRHRDIYRRWMKEQHVTPLSLSQYYRYVKAHADLEDDISKLVPALNDSHSNGMLMSAGPGDAYELDATGGQIVLMASGHPAQRIYRPVIYIIIDRWSRYIVSVYVTLRPCSWEALRIALRVAFTSRDRRFAHLGLPVTDEEWPPGVPPARLFCDRGSDMISEQMLKATVEGLRIVDKIVPPLTPDAKGIVERVIGVLKKKMKSRTDLPAQYHKLLDSPQKKASKKRVALVAVTSLAELYRAFLEEVIAHNARQHRALQKRSILKKNGISPIPRDAYAFGLKHLTGIQRPPMTDDDYARLTMTSDRARLNSNGTLTYKSRRYLPSNTSARRYCELHKPGVLGVNVDPSYPHELSVPSSKHPWPQWDVDRAGAKDLEDITLEEQVALAHAYEVLAAQATDAELRQAGVRRPRMAQGQDESTRQAASRRRQAESDGLTRALFGSPGQLTSQDAVVPAENGNHGLRRTSKNSSKQSNRTSIEELEAQERARVVEENRKRRLR